MQSGNNAKRVVERLKIYQLTEREHLIKQHRQRKNHEWMDGVHKGMRCVKLA